MPTQLNRQCLEVLHATTVNDFVRISAEFGESMGFHTMAAMVVTDHSPSLTEFRSITNASAEYMSTFEDMDSAKLDPVSQHCKKFSTPIIWHQKTYVEAGRGHLWEHQAAFGFQSGICLAFHLARGRHFVFGLSSAQKTCSAPSALLGLTLDVHLFASYAQAAASHLCLPYPPCRGSSTLAVGELDALRLSMDGLTEWEVGQAMGISETEALLRLRIAMRKLGCATKYEAALRAIRLGLVDCG